MTERNEAPGSDESLERLLARATPRPVPGSHDARLMRNAVHAEWQSVIRKRRRYRRTVALAIAASVVTAIGLVLNTLRVPGPDRTAVATVARSFGSLYTVGQQSELHVAEQLAELRAGETILTDGDSGVALAWNTGGSLRIDASTRITFASDTEIELHSGRVYFDSDPFGADNGSTAGPLAIRTQFGIVSHLGTQYMAATDGRSLAVSVREGRVAIDGSRHDATAAAGQQLRLTDTGRPVVVAVSPYGEPWAWVENTAPPIEMDGRNLHDFLRWAARESGLELRFADPAAEQIATTTILKGRVDAAVREAVSIRLQTTDLEARIEDGVISVSRSDAHATP